MVNNNRTTRQQRKIRSSRKVRGTDDMPRLSVARSNYAMQAQIINDAKGITILGVSETHLKEKGKTPTSSASGELRGASKTDKARALGMLLAEEAKKHKVTKVVFDKGEYRYHGRVKAFAEGAREGGLQF